ncbi:endo-1,4-beta-xylanase [Pandoraea sputorum]|uniref:endo-1,4-beta-xylanase n=1 Tax=Pandoraea sputorum TaxID=93222 RepID=UPI0012418240|nr:endo-1,4-beta-xylanase [Pandoraea sputorum]VVE82950.1 Exoglucanase/xylanase [Pandoraea sputorum]
MHSTDRRRFLHRTLVALAAMPLDIRRTLAASATPFPSLREIVRANGLDFGFALDPARLASDATYRAVVARQASIVVPENALKWQAVHPEPDHYDFSAADSIAAFAQTHGQRMRGHTFCWHRALPDWVSRMVTPANAQTVLTTHIDTVARHYRGKMQSWDVVNEAIQLQDGLPGGLRDTFWYRMLGVNYLDMAFHAAHAADPHAVLGYNDYGLESDTHAGQSKRAAVLSMLKGLRQRNVPVHALGIQSHLRATDPHSFGPGLAPFIQAVRELGLAVYVTELDVDDSRIVGSVQNHDAAVAATYKRYLDLVLGTGAVSAVLTWGVWDSPHRTGATPADGPPAQRPLVFAPGGAIKAASWVVAHCLQRTPSIRG